MLKFVVTNDLKTGTDCKSAPAGYTKNAFILIHFIHINLGIIIVRNGWLLLLISLLVSCFRQGA